MTLSLYDLNNDKADRILATNSTHGLMSKNDKAKLDALSIYTHPATHSASMITGLSIIATTGNYNDLINKPTIPTSLPANGGNADTLDSKHAEDFLSISGGTINGLLSLTDTTVQFKRVSDSALIESNTQYVLLNGRLGSFITNNSYWDGSIYKKYDIIRPGGYLTVNDNGIFYVHSPANFDMDGSSSFKIWHSGNMGHNSNLDADKLDGKHANEFANVSHTHTIASIIEDDSHLFINQEDKNKLDSISFTANKTTSSIINGNIKIDNVETIVYTHPISHLATMITEDVTHRFVTDTQISTWNNKASTNVVTPSSNGLMIPADKNKLDGISFGANRTSISVTNGNVKIDNVEITVYNHPDNHPASIISEDITHRFVTDVEKNTWNNKASVALATPSSAGLMSAGDKTKLDNILDYVADITRKSRCGGI